MATSTPTIPPLAKTTTWNGIAFLVVGALTRFGFGMAETGLMFMGVGTIMVAVGLVWMAAGAVRARRRHGGDPG